MRVACIATHSRVARTGRPAKPADSCVCVWLQRLPGGTHRETGKAGRFVRGSFIVREFHGFAALGGIYEQASACPWGLKLILQSQVRRVGALHPPQE